MSIIVNIFYVDLEIELLLFKQLTCTEYYCVFQLTNKLFWYIKKRHDFECRTRQVFVKIFYINKAIVESNQIIDNLELIKSNIKTIIDTNLIFRLYYYTTILLEFGWQNLLYTICVNIEYTIILIDCKFLKNLVLNLFIKKIQTLISMRNVNIARYLIDNYLVLNIYIKNYIRNRKFVAHIC